MKVYSHSATLASSNDIEYLLYHLDLEEKKALSLYCKRGVDMLNIYRIFGLAAIGLAVLAEPAFANTGGPGPIAGVGLPALALIGGAYWVGHKLFGGKK